MSTLLFATVALAWGFTWYAIHLQLGATPDIVSIFWRFATASGLLWLGLAVTGRIKPARFRQHPWFAALGLTLFSGNFVFLYAAEHNVPSGLVAMIFSMASVFNAANQWWYRGIRPSLRTLLGAAAGVIGMVFLFENQISASEDGHYIWGIVFALAGTYSFSLGNLVSGRATRDGTDLPNAVARGMSWGAVALALVILTQRESFIPYATPSYLAGLAYLSVIGSVVGFLAYLSLVSRVGASKAAYVTVISPVIALVVSSAFEHYAWAPLSALGIVLIGLGNIIIFLPARRPPVFR